MKKQTQSSLPRALSLAVFMAAFGVFLGPALFAQGGPGGGMGGNRPGGDLVVVASAASKGRTVTVGGRTAPVRKITHTVTVAGFVDRLLVTTGERVQEGQALLRVSRDAVGETFRPVILESRLQGVVSQIHVYEKEAVSAGTLAVTILDDSSFVLQVSLSDSDAGAVRSLGPVPVVGKTPDGTSYRGKIQYVSAEPDYTTGLFTLSMEFPRQANLSLGLVLFVDLVAEKAQGLTVNSSAVMRRDSQTFLWTLNQENKLVPTAVTLGEAQNGLFSVKEGLMTGDRYVGKVSGKEVEGMTIRELLQANLGAGAGTVQGGQ